MRKTLAVSLCGIALAGIVLAQTADKPPAETPPANQVGGLRFLNATEVTVVSFAVAVSDKKGPVRGLTADDFEVRQDGKVQQISNFAAFAAAPPQPTPTAAAVPPSPTPTPAAGEPKREPRFIVLYVDNENLLPFDRNRVLNRMSEWIQQHLTAPDQAMVASYQKSMKIKLPFTSDPEEVADALRSLKNYTGGRSDVVNTRKDISDYIHENASQRNSIDEALSKARSFAREQHNTLMFTVRALQDLVNMMTGLPGKKSIIYVSDGLPMTPGLEVFYDIQDQYRDPSTISQSRDYDSTSLFRGLITSASAAGVTFYTIDARGLETNLGMDAENQQPRSTLGASIERTNYQDSLVYMAEQTGGLAIINTNDVMPGLEKIATEFDTYYSLGYHLVPTGQDRLHNVEVIVKGHPEYRLNYRHTFVEKSLQTQIGDRVMTGLAFDLEDNPLGIELSVGEPAPASAGRWTLPVEIRVPIEKIALIPDGNELVGYLMAYYAARDNEGKQSDLQRTEATVRIPAAEYEKARHQFYTVTASLLIEPGRYKISVGLRDQLTNQAGYAGIRSNVHPELM